MNQYQTIEVVESEKEKIFVIHERFERLYNTHCHSKGQLSYVEDGIAYLTIKNQQFIVPAKYFIWIPSEIPHKLKVSHSATQLHSFYFPKSLGIKNDFYDEFGIYPAGDLIVSIIKFSERWNEEFIDDHTEFYELMKSFYLLISEKKDNNLSLMLPFSEKKHVIKITNYILENYHQNLSLEFMTLKFNMSKRTFTRWFKKELGVSFIQYLKSVRILKSIELLLKTNLSIAEIANNVGYDSLSSFSNLFFQFTGKRPMEMRKYFD